MTLLIDFDMNDEIFSDKFIEWIKSPEFDIWTKNSEFRHNEEYIQRGRAYSKLSDEMVLQEWRRRLHLHANDPEALEKYREYRDIESELSIRSIKLSFFEMREDCQVREDYEKLRKFMQRRIEELKKNPLELQRRNQQMIDEIVDCVSEIEEGTKNLN
jgi:hypothetical protein